MNQEKIRELFPFKCSAQSGIAYSIGLFPHLLVLLGLYFMEMPVPLSFLFLSYFGALFLGEYFFWSMLKGRLELANEFVELKLKSFDRKELNTYILAFTSEVLIDAIIIFKSIDAGWEPLNGWILLLGLKFIAAPIQSVLSQVLLSDNLAYGIALSTQVLGILLIGRGPEMVLYAILLKGLFCNAIAVSRSQFANREVLDK